MSAYSVCTAPFAVAVPNEDWEAPLYPPPPLPPPAPPLPILMQKEVKICFWDGNMFARPPPSRECLLGSNSSKMLLANVSSS